MAYEFDVTGTYTPTPPPTLYVTESSDDALVPQHISVPTVYIVLAATVVVVCVCGGVGLLLWYVRKTRTDLTKTVQQMTAALRDVHQMQSVQSISPSPNSPLSPSQMQFSANYAMAAGAANAEQQTISREPSRTQTMPTNTMPTAPSMRSLATAPSMRSLTTAPTSPSARGGTVTQLYPWAVPPPLPALPNSTHPQNNQCNSPRVHFAQNKNQMNHETKEQYRNRIFNQQRQQGAPQKMQKSRSVEDENGDMLRPNLRAQSMHHSAQPYYGAPQQSQQPTWQHPNQLMAAQATSSSGNDALCLDESEVGGRRSINGYQDLEQASIRHAQSMPQRRNVPQSVRDLLVNVSDDARDLQNRRDLMVNLEMHPSETYSASMAEETGDESSDDSAYTEGDTDSDDFDENELDDHFDVRGVQRLTINVEPGIQGMTYLPSEMPAMQKAASNARALDRLRNSNRPTHQTQDTTDTIDTVNTATTANTNDTLMVHAGDNSHVFGLPANVELKKMGSTEL